MSNRELTADERADVNTMYGSALWYAFGRLDSGTYIPSVKRHLDAFKFADFVKAKRTEFIIDTKVISFESIQGQWERWVAETLQRVTEVKSKEEK